MVGRLRWTWDWEKDRANRTKHGLGFKIAARVFDDPTAISRRDPYQEEERWRTIGTVRTSIVFVVHTWPDDNWPTGGDAGRIISARKATAEERKAYAERRF
jgi:hypothetical protein